MKPVDLFSRKEKRKKKKEKKKKERRKKKRRKKKGADSVLVHSEQLWLGKPQNQSVAALKQKTS